MFTVRWCKQVQTWDQNDAKQYWQVFTCHKCTFLPFHDINANIDTCNNLWCKQWYCYTTKKIQIPCTSKPVSSRWQLAVLTMLVLLGCTVSKRQCTHFSRRYNFDKVFDNINHCGRPLKQLLPTRVAPRSSKRWQAVGIGTPSTVTATPSLSLLGCTVSLFTSA